MRVMFVTNRICLITVLAAFSRFGPTNSQGAKSDDTGPTSDPTTNDTDPTSDPTTVEPPTKRPGPGSDKCEGGRKNGRLTTKCLMEMVEAKSDNGKMVFNREREQFVVNITFTLMSIDDLSNDGTLRTRLRIKIAWFDDDLRWNPKQLKSREDLIVMPSSLARWPRFILLYDQDPVRSLVQKLSDFPVVIRNDGRNSMSGEVSAVSSCNMRMASFPNDVQTCRIKIAPLPLGIKSVMDVSVKYEHSDALFDESLEWPLKPSYTEENLEKGSTPISVGGGGELDYVFMQIRVQRNGHDVNVALTTPMYTFSFVTAIAYLLPPHSGERIGTAITMVLTLAVSMLAVKDMIPTANRDPFFSIFCQITFAQTMFLFFESILISILWNSDSPHFILNWRSRQKSSESSTMTASKSSTNPSMISKRRRASYTLNQEKEGKEEEKEELSRADFWKRFAVKMDLTFALINLILSVVAVTWTTAKINDPPIPRARWNQ